MWGRRIEADAAGGVAGGFDDGEGLGADFDDVAFFNKLIYWWDFQSIFFQPMFGTLIG